jgi:hypothetical protein
MLSSSLETEILPDAPLSEGTPPEAIPDATPEAAPEPLDIFLEFLNGFYAPPLSLALAFAEL